MLYIYKAQALIKIHSDKTNGTKNALFFLSRAPTHHSLLLICDSYVNQTKVRLSKTVSAIFHFPFRFVFIRVYIFVQ